MFRIVALPDVPALTLDNSVVRPSDAPIRPRALAEPAAVRLGRSLRRPMLGAGGRLGGNAVRICGSCFGAGVVRLVRIRNAH
jgi:hypothetical protein